MENKNTNTKEKQMTKNSKLETALQLLEAAQSNLNSALAILSDSKVASSGPIKATKPANYPKSTGKAIVEEEGEFIEGVFDGQSMIDAEGKKYPVQANYASKSKLVAGDILKLTILADGRFLYKQIGPVERKNVIGILNQESGHHFVMVNGKKFNVLLASVTYFKAKPGDEVTIIIPANEDSDWACIENVLTA